MVNLYAVQLNPSSVAYHDSIGVAHALVGDTRGVSADFTFVVQLANGYGDLNAKQIQECRQWLQEPERETILLMRRHWLHYNMNRIKRLC